MSDETDLNQKIVVDGVSMSLADIAGISLDGVKELRGEAFPKGVFQWEVDSENPPKLGVIGEGDKARGGVPVTLKCINVITVNDPDFAASGQSEDSLIGKLHRETFFLSTAESLGYLKAFFADIGAPYDPDMLKLLAGSPGTRFQAPIGKRKSKDDADVIYTNIVRQKIKPMERAAQSDVAAAVAA